MTREQFIARRELFYSDRFYVITGLLLSQPVTESSEIMAYCGLTREQTTRAIGDLKYDLNLPIRVTRTSRGQKSGHAMYELVLDDE